MQISMRSALLLLVTAGMAGVAAPVFAQGIGISVGGGGASVSVGTGGASVDVGVSTDLGTTTTQTLQDAGTMTEGSQQEAALQAVKSDRALPLDKIIALAKQYTSGEIIDAQLVTVRGFLLYDLKVLDAKGDVGDLYFYAVSGKIVRTQ